jgi:hypothetical protein
MNRAEALRSVISSLNAEIAAMKAFDVGALASATASKERSIGALQDVERNEVTDEVRALAAEAAQLNETARVFVNLMSANVRRQLEQLTGSAPAQTYGRAGLRVVA